jgi:hypothetical protein
MVRRLDALHDSAVMKNAADEVRIIRAPVFGLHVVLRAQPIDIRVESLFHAPPFKTKYITMIVQRNSEFVLK